MTKLKEVWISNRSELRLDFDNRRHFAFKIEAGMTQVEVARALSALSQKLLNQEREDFCKEIGFTNELD